MTGVSRCLHGLCNVARLGRYTDPIMTRIPETTLSSSHLLILDRGQDFFYNL